LVRRIVIDRVFEVVWFSVVATALAAGGALAIGVLTIRGVEGAVRRALV
jgi:hypothetical protein